MWALKNLKLDWGDASDQRLSQVNELDEFRLKAYESSVLYEKRKKIYHDRKIGKRDFAPSDLVLLFNSMLCLFPSQAEIKVNGTIPSGTSIPIRCNRIRKL